jgi:hypothetical protein
MEVGKRVKVTNSDFTFSGQEGTITAISTGKYRIIVRLDSDNDEWPFNDDELELVEAA